MICWMLGQMLAPIDHACRSPRRCGLMLSCGLTTAQSGRVLEARELHGNGDRGNTVGMVLTFVGLPREWGLMTAEIP